VHRTIRSAFVITAAVIGSTAATHVPPASAAPAPEVEYLYDVTVRRHYSFPADTDALQYGRGICDRVIRGETYAQVMDGAKHDVTPNDEFATDYLVSYTVNLLCPEQIWQLRRSAAGYSPPPG
jgi:hypothetical protein